MLQISPVAFQDNISMISNLRPGGLDCLQIDRRRAAGLDGPPLNLLSASEYRAPLAVSSAEREFRPDLQGQPFMIDRERGGMKEGEFQLHQGERSTIPRGVLHSDTTKWLLRLGAGTYQTVYDDFCIDPPSPVHKA